MYLQPDRTHCFSDWLPHVIDMVNFYNGDLTFLFPKIMLPLNYLMSFQSLNSTYCAKNITDEILENIGNDNSSLTSGTLMELVKIGPRLAKLWFGTTVHEHKGNYSTRINMIKESIANMI